MASVRQRFSLEGRQALVTGASRGIGLALCVVLSEAGADIVAVARDEAGLEDARQAVEANGRRCLVLRADLGQAAEPERVGRAALAAWGTIDILVNNAGISIPKTLVEQTIEEWDLIQAVNLRAPWLLARTLAPAMMAQQQQGKLLESTKHSRKDCDQGQDDSSHY